MAKSTEKPFPYVKFRMMKNKSDKQNPSGVMTPEDWYLNVSGCHNSIQRIADYIKARHRLLGHGNLDSPKYAEIRNFIDAQTGVRSDPRLFDDAPPQAMADKVKEQQSIRSARQ